MGPFRAFHGFVDEGGRLLKSRSRRLASRIAVSLASGLVILAVAGCAVGTSATSGSVADDTAVRVRFAEPREVLVAGHTVSVGSVVGRVANIARDTAIVRVTFATLATGGTTSAISGIYVPVAIGEDGTDIRILAHAAALRDDIFVGSVLGLVGAFVLAIIRYAP